MSALINQRSRFPHARLLVWSVALIAISSLGLGAQTTEQPLDFELKDGWPQSEIVGWQPWPSHWNRDPRSVGYAPPAASIALAEDYSKLTYTVTASGGLGYRGDFLQIFASAPGAKFVVTTRAQKTVLRKPRDPKAAPVQEVFTASSTHTFESLAQARAAVAGINAETLSQVPEPTGPAGDGVYLGLVGSPSVVSTVMADSWQLIAKAGTPQTIAGFPAGFNHNDNGMQGQTFTGDIPFDVGANQGRQVMMERWTLQITAASDYRLELQSLDPIDVPSVTPTAEVVPLVSTKTITVNGEPRVVKLMDLYDGTIWKAALGRDGVRFLLTGESSLSPISKIEIQANLRGSIEWITIPEQNEPNTQTRIGYFKFIAPIAALGQKTIKQTVSLYLGELCTDTKHLIPLNEEQARTWTFRTKLTNRLGQESYSDLAKVEVVLPLKIKNLGGKTLPPVLGSDGGNGWFNESSEQNYTLKIWTYGIPE